MVKLNLLFLFFVIGFAAVILRLFSIQMLNTKALPTDYLRTQRLHPERGKILDRNEHPLALNQTTYILFALPKKIGEKSDLVRRLDEVLKLGEATLEARIDTSKDWVRITGGITKDTKDVLTKLVLKGIGFDEDMKRYYPEASLSAHILGFVGKNTAGEDTGYFGIEGFYDKELAGLPGLVTSERDLIGRPIFFGTQEKVDSENGRDLVLTIDNAVQTIVKNKLNKALEQYKAKEGCVIVADPMTMEIVSMACLPDFDPATYYTFTEEYFKNSAISNLYEPGSTFKPLIIAAAIEQKTIKPDDIYDEKGPIGIGEYTIQTWNNTYEGKISMTRILEKSSNVGMVYVGDKMGNQKVYDTIRNYGFGDVTGIDLQGEVSGTIKSEDAWYPIDYATATFGQGIAVTPIQMIRAFSALINGGRLMGPNIVKRVVDSTGSKEHEPKVVRRIISERTSEIIKKMLVSTVEKGEVRWAKPTGYAIGGKTGTAQVPIAGHYDPTKTIASFIGFAPADKPKFIALVILREPQTSQWGSETAAPLFFDIAKELLVYYNIPPGNQ